MRADQKYIMSKRDPRTLDEHLRDIQSHLEQGLTVLAIEHIDALREAMWHARYPTPDEKEAAWQKLCLGWKQELAKLTKEQGQ